MVFKRWEGVTEPKIGRLKKIKKHLYQDRITKEVFPWRVVEPVVSRSIAIGKLGSPNRGRYEKSIDTLTDQLGVTRGEVRERFIEWLADYEMRKTGFEDAFAEIYPKGD